MNCLHTYQDKYFNLYVLQHLFQYKLKVVGCFSSEPFHPNGKS